MLGSLEIPFALQVLGGGADPGDTAGRWDVVSGHVVSEEE